MKAHLKDKTILITGGNRGIGGALSAYFAQNGAQVAVHFNSNLDLAKELVTRYGDAISLFPANLSNYHEVSSLFDRVIKQLGKMDVVINNAGIAISSDFLGDDDQWIADWQKTLNVNLTATGLICKKSIAYFIKNKITGRIINISSRAAFRGDTSDYLAYAASKGGVVALTRSIARAYGKNNIMAFNVAPGFVRTDMAQAFFDQYGEDYAINDIALNKLTEPEDIAPLVGLLASGLADHATGGTFDINAGSYVH